MEIGGENVSFSIIDTETGEYRGNFNPEFQEIKNKKQIEYYEKHKAEIEKNRIYNFGQSNKFTMLNQNAARELANEKITGSEYQIMFLMMANTNYKSGLITKGNNHSIDMEWLSEQLNIKQVTVERCIKKFIDKGIVCKGETASKIQYFFNPYIQYKGAWINATLYAMFKNTKWALQAKEEREKELKRREAMEISKAKRRL